MRCSALGASRALEQRLGVAAEHAPMHAAAHDAATGAGARLRAGEDRAADAAGAPISAARPAPSSTATRSRSRVERLMDGDVARPAVAWVAR